MEHPFAFLTGKEYLEQLSESSSPKTSISVAEESSGEDNCRSISLMNCTSHLILVRYQINVAVMDEAYTGSMRSEGKDMCTNLGRSVSEEYQRLGLYGMKISKRLL